MELDFFVNDTRKKSVEKLLEENKATQVKLFHISLIMVGFLLGWVLCYLSYPGKPACYRCTIPGPLSKSINRAKLPADHHYKI